MGHTSRKRRTTKAQRAMAAAAALVMGAGGLVVANVYASASGTVPRDGGELRQLVATIDCPDVGNELTDVPDGARAGVDGELAALDSQITESYRRLADSRDDAARDPGFVRDSILTPLGNDRAAALERIQARIRGNGGTPPRRFDSLAACTGRTPRATGPPRTATVAVRAGASARARAVTGTATAGSAAVGRTAARARETAADRAGATGRRATVPSPPTSPTSGPSGRTSRCPGPGAARPAARSPRAAAPTGTGCSIRTT